MKLHRQYSGKRSKNFWKAIRSIENVEEHDKLYGMGVQLQNLESIILTEIKKINKVPKITEGSGCVFCDLNLMVDSDGYHFVCGRYIACDKPEVIVNCD